MGNIDIYLLVVLMCWVHIVTFFNIQYMQLSMPVNYITYADFLVTSLAKLSIISILKRSADGILTKKQL